MHGPRMSTLQTHDCKASFSPSVPSQSWHATFHNLNTFPRPGLVSCGQKRFLRKKQTSSRHRTLPALRGQRRRKLNSRAIATFVANFPVAAQSGSGSFVRWRRYTCKKRRSVVSDSSMDGTSNFISCSDHMRGDPRARLKQM